MSIKDKKLIVLIPAYKPDLKLVDLIGELNKKKISSVVVDDGSGSEYKNIFSKCKTNVITYDENKGKGFALKKGLKYIDKNYKNYIVVTMDSDGQHKVSDALSLYDYVKDNDNVLVLGKRYRGDNMPVRSRIGNRITRFFFRLASGYDIYDTQTGLRAYSDKLTKYVLSIEGNRYDYEMNVLLNLKKENILVKEIDIEVIYVDGNKHSHFKVVSDSIKIYKKIFKSLFHH